jgi:enoyl-CoA hydratase/carnithine racemase
MQSLALRETEVAVEPSGLCMVYLARPERGNSMTMRVFEELDWLFRTANEDDTVKVVVVAGKGPRFCVGAELAQSASGVDATPVTRDEAGVAAMSVARCRKPVVVAMHGAAVGGGITIFLAADIRVAEADCKIAFPFVRRGLTMEATSSYNLPRIVGLGKALELCLTGKTFLAKNEPRLFSEVVPSGQALQRARAIAEDMIANTSLVSLLFVKASLTANAQHPLDAHQLESRFILECRKQGGEFEEGRKSFVEKRAPKFTGTARDANAVIDQHASGRAPVPPRRPKL